VGERIPASHPVVRGKRLRTRLGRLERRLRRIFEASNWERRGDDSMSNERVVRIGSASGSFWGDTASAAPQLVRRGDIQYLPRLPGRGHHVDHGRAAGAGPPRRRTGRPTSCTSR
jgi:hypothetical protein